ncbi:MAG: hypothetical protein DRI69_04975 [Bacteroidetes bacterium]|nr:MAG: hypothetical protein DRI69_04975 [Bacteroidota bacterium]
MFLGYFLLLSFYLWHWNRIVPLAVDEDENQANISVVIPVRNEAPGIIRCIDSILAQNFRGTFDIIIVDDHSTDETVKIVRERYDLTDHVKLVLLSDKSEKAEGKKAALKAGIAEAPREVIITTDGDCVYSPLWLATLSSYFTPSVQIVTGPVVYPEGTKMLQGFQALDLLSLILATAAGIQSRSYFLGNGANLAFRKSAFIAVDGYSGNEGFVSGDDLFLIEKITGHFGDHSIRYAKSPDAAVLTQPQETLRTFLSQRLRWASKNGALGDRRVFYLWSFLWVVNASVVVLLILGILGYVPLLMVGIILYIKMMLEGIALYQVAQYFSMKSVMRWFPWAFFLNVLYVVAIGLMTILAPSFKWKGRDGMIAES